MKEGTIKNLIKKSLLGIVCLMLLFSCDDRLVENDKILEQAYELSDRSAMESLGKLDIISDPNELSEAQRSRYNLLQAKSCMRTKKSIHDSVFNIPISYYKSIKDTALLYESFNLLAFKKYREKDYTASLKYYEKSQYLLPFFNINREYVLNAAWRIDNLLALKRYQEAEEIAIATLVYAEENDEKRNIIDCFFRIARINSDNNNIAAGERNYLKVLQLWEEIGNKFWQQQTLDALALLMERIDMYDKALAYLMQSEKLDLSRKDIPKRNLIKSMLCQRRNELDSANYYAKIASQGSDPLIASLATYYISECLAEDGDLFNAYHKRWTAIQIARGINSGINSDKESEDFAKKELENKAKILKIMQEKRNLLFVIVVIVLLLLVVVVYMFFYRKQRKQYELHLKNKAVQLEQENLLLSQSKEISVLREKESLLRESLFRRIDIFKKIPSVKAEVAGCVDRRKIALTENDLKDLVETIDDAYPAFTHKLKVAYPLLTTADIHFCCFLKIDVNQQDLSDIYCVSKSAIIKKKYRIKTYKFCITDTSISLDDFLKKFEVKSNCPPAIKSIVL